MDKVLERSIPSFDEVLLFASQYMREPFLAGGCVASLYDKVEIKDYDVYSTLPTDLHKLKEQLDLDGIYFTELKGVVTVKHKGYEIQLITSKLMGIFSIPYSFDFSACMMAYRNGIIYATKQAVQDATNKHLELVNLYSVSTKYRILRYRQKGYSGTTFAALKYLAMRSHWTEQNDTY